MRQRLWPHPCRGSIGLVLQQSIENDLKALDTGEYKVDLFQNEIGAMELKSSNNSNSISF